MPLVLIPASQANAAIAAMFAPGGFWLSLHSGSPGTTGTGELTNSGGSTYARQAITLGAAALGVEASTNAQSFGATSPGLPGAAGPIYCGLWTASTGGTYLGGLVTVGLTGGITAGSSITFPIGDTTVDVQG
jgi:hypothetical protein